MTESDDSPTGVAAAYFEAWKSKDINRVRPLLHDDVTFDGALGSTRGIEETIAGLGRMFAITEHVEVVRHWLMAPTLDLVRAPYHDRWTACDRQLEPRRSGRIARIRVTFDPRPLLG